MKIRFLRLTTLLVILVMLLSACGQQAPPAQAPAVESTERRLKPQPEATAADANALRGADSSSPTPGPMATPQP